MSEKRHDNREQRIAPDEASIADLVGDEIARSPDHAIWRDERFLKWLTERQIDAAPGGMARAGRQLMVRAYSRQFRFLLLAGRPSVVELPAFNSDKALAPLVSLGSFLPNHAASSATAVVLPEACRGSDCVALRVTGSDHLPAPFIEEGDTLLVALETPRWSPALIIRDSDHRCLIANGDNPERAVGTVIALWSVAMAT